MTHNDEGKPKCEQCILSGGVHPSSAGADGIEETNAIGLISKQGANGGTFGHSEIGCAFRMWLYPEFQLKLIQKYMYPADGEERDDL